MTRSSRKRMTGEQRKAQIIDSAIALFGRHGFKGTTTRALAEAADVSEGTIFKHFPTKDHLYAAAFQRRTGVGTEQLVAELERLAEAGDDEQMLRRLFRAILTGYELDRDLHRMLLYAWLEQQGDENRRMWAQMRRASPLFDFLERFVTQRQAEGLFAPGTPGSISAALLALPVHVATRTKLYGLEAAHPDDVTAARLTRLLLDGVRVRPDAGGGPAAREPAAPGRCGTT